MKCCSSRPCQGCAGLGGDGGFLHGPVQGQKIEIKKKIKNVEKLEKLKGYPPLVACPGLVWACPALVWACPGLLWACPGLLWACPGLV